MQNFLRAYACKKLVRTANYGFASKWSGGEAVWIPGRKGGGRRGVIGAAVAACRADLCRVVSSSCIPAASRRRAKIVPQAQFSRGTELRKHRFSGRLTPVPPERSRRNA